MQAHCEGWLAQSDGAVVLYSLITSSTTANCYAVSAFTVVRYSSTAIGSLERHVLLAVVAVALQDESRLGYRWFRSALLCHRVLDFDVIEHPDRSQC